MSTKYSQNNQDKPVPTGNNNEVEIDEDLKDLSKRFFKAKITVYKKDLEGRKKELKDTKKIIEAMNIEKEDLNEEIEDINEKIRFYETELKTNSINLLMEKKDMKRLLRFYEAFIEIDDILRQLDENGDDSDKGMTLDYFFDLCDTRKVDALEIYNRLSRDLCKKIVMTED